jgi:hypothetical protein
MRRLSIGGIFVGVFASFATYFGLMLPVFIYLIVVIRLFPAEANRSSGALGVGLWFVLNVLIAGVSAIVGGYATSRVVNHDELLNALYFVVMLSAGQLGHVLADRPEWKGLSFAMLVASIIGGFLGYYLRRAQKRRHPPSPTTDTERSTIFQPF